MPIKQLEGWGQIADCISEIVGVDISKDRVRRWANRHMDPLPARRLGKHKRPMIVADPRGLEDWARREFVEHPKRH